MEKNYQLALLYFVHLLIGADGVADRTEVEALDRIKQKENISDQTFADFNKAISSRSERETYQIAIDHLSKCNEAEKLKVFGTLYRLSEVDGRVHTKEIKLLLYSIEDAGIEFNDVVDYAKANPSIF
jgi:uncharacterized tellurite resistance protein B-like protein